MINAGLIFIFGVFMLWLARKDWQSYERGEHIDYKGMIVSTGILGTFFGIVLGLWNFDTSDIVSSVPLLLDGLKLAFLTSIFGMGLSIWLSVKQAKPEEKPKDDSKLDKINQSLENITRILQELKKISQRDYRFTKIDANGEILGEKATTWAAIQDNETGLFWQYKTKEEGKQEYEPEKIAEYVKAINEKNLAGSKNWRLPSEEELQNLIKAGIDKRYFPNSQKGLYYSLSNKSEDFCLKLETGRSYAGIPQAHLLLVK